MTANQTNTTSPTSRKGVSRRLHAADETERLARVRLSSVTEPGDLRVTSLVSELGASKVLEYLEAAGDVAAHWAFTIGQEFALVDPARVLEQAAAKGIRFVVPGDNEWPRQLAGLRGAGARHDRGGEPVGLWVRGNHELHQLALTSVAVVGSRAATSYGTEQATEFSHDLASMGHPVVSGLAYGVDEAAHRGALMAKGTTIAVLPEGVDRPYPSANASLLDEIANRSLVVSEAPPGTEANRTRFLARNRIVAGLAEGTLLIEAAHRSGALDTAEWAGNLRRPVMGLPGPVTSAASAGVNQMIRLGQASAVIDAQDVITDLSARPDRASAAGQVDESYVPAPVRSQDAPVPGGSPKSLRQSRFDR
ncbi:DNA-processing protein DprA [Janibacter sp. G1551]|jgi:DNA processing protein|uniref:DNA-processing protein DprA n=1 Tax=Janibacter sp. G1551 TaxID=3420440 RepID=UPI003D06DFF9